MLVDTHCHLNFKAFWGKEKAVIKRANNSEVGVFVVPGADLSSSQRAVAVANKFSSVYAAVGIHPHHVQDQQNTGVANDLEKLAGLLTNKKIVAVGEVGIDKYQYPSTKYPNYQVTKEFIKQQKQALVAQIALALQYNKALILHNRQGIEELLSVLEQRWDQKLADRTVLHCCEPDERLLDFALTHRVYLGVDGDLSWSRKKQRFLTRVPTERLVLETDSPYLKPKFNSNWPKAISFPEDLVAEQINEPKNIALIQDLVACFQQIDSKEVEKHTTENALRLFQIMV